MFRALHPCIWVRLRFCICRYIASPEGTMNTRDQEILHSLMPVGPSDCIDKTGRLVCYNRELAELHKPMGHRPKRPVVAPRVHERSWG